MSTASGRRTFVVGVVLALGLATAAPGADIRAEVGAIRALDAKWLEAIAAKNLDWIANLYADRARFMAPGAPEARGREAIRAAWQGMLAAPGPSLTFTAKEIHVAGSADLAFEVGTWQLGEADHGKYVVVWAKRGTEWKVVADIFNSDRPVAEPAPTE